MSNGNDWQGGNNDWQQSSNQPANAGGGQQLQPHGGAGGAGGGQGAGNGDYGAGGSGFEPPGGGPPLDAVTEGWGGGPEVTLDEVIERFKLVANRAIKGPVLKAWLLVAVVTLIVPMLNAFLEIVAHFLDSVAMDGALWVVSMGFEVIGVIISMAAGALQLSMYKPLHRTLFEGEHMYSGPMDVINAAKGPFVAMLILMLVLSLTIGLGTACCVVPGVFIAFVTCQAPYIVATQDVDFMEGIKRSFTLNKTYWMPIVIAIASLFVIGAIAGCFVGVGMFIVDLVTSLIAPFNEVLAPGIYWLFIQLATFGIFLVWTALFSTLETKETGKLVS